MASEKSVTTSGGIGLSTLLTVLFIGLKLGHVIDWKWVWVLAPLWISASLGIGIFLIIALVVILLNK